MTETVLPKRRMDWLANVIYPLAVVLMEAFWVYPWLKWLGGWPMYPDPRPALGLGAVVAVVIIALAATRYINRREGWPLAAARAGIVVLGVAVGLVTLRLEYAPPPGVGWFAHLGQLLSHTFDGPSTVILAMPAFIYLWWRGIVLGRTTTYFKDIYRSFMLGMVALVLLIIIWQISSGSDRFPPLGADMGWNVIGFFFFGLLAIAVCHLYTMRSAMAKEDAAATSVWRWLPVMLVVIGGMVLIGFALASVISPEFFSAVGTAFGYVGKGLGKLIEWISVPLNYVAEAIMWVLRWIISRLRTDPPADNTTANATAGGMGFEEVVPKELPPAVTEGIKWFVIVLIVAAIVFFLARAIGRFRDKRRGEDIEEIHESLFSWAGLKDDLKSMLDGMKDRFAVRRRRRRYCDYADDLSGDLDVREIYRRTLREAARSGLPRHPWETTREYARRVQHLVPESLEPLDGITGAYEDIRYGESPVIEERGLTNRLWQALRGVLRGLRGE